MKLRVYSMSKSLPCSRTDCSIVGAAEIVVIPFPLTSVLSMQCALHLMLMGLSFLPVHFPASDNDPPCRSTILTRMLVLLKYGLYIGILWYFDWSASYCNALSTALRRNDGPQSRDGDIGRSDREHSYAL